MRVVPADDGGVLDLRGHTLIVPGIGGLAHLGELCLDALVATFGLQRVVVLQSRYLLPVAMASAWEKSPQPLSLTTGAELYQSANAPRLTVLQLRTEAADGRRRAVAEELWAWAREVGIAEIVVVTSCSSHVKVDADLGATTELRYAHVAAEGGGSSQCPLGPGGMDLPLLPLSHSLGCDANQGNPDQDLKAVEEMLSGGGLARPLLRLAGGARAEGTEAPGVLCLMGFTSEIINWQLTERLAKVTCLCAARKAEMQEAPSFRVPLSWQFEAAESARQIWG